MSEIDWSKAPDWADRVVRGGMLDVSYWANDCKLKPLNNSCPPFKTNTHVRDNFQVVERRPTADTGIDWSKAPDWADRVVRSPRKRQLFWADDIQRQLIISGHQGVNNLHVRDNWAVVERRPTINTGIEWSKAPEWADRVVRLPGMVHLYWADDTQRQSVEHGHYQKDRKHVEARWLVVERRPAHFPTRPPETFMCRCVALPVSSTIEQRIASLRALEKRVEETRAELTRDLEALGLTWMVQDEPTITDWRDLRIGDVVEYVSGGQEWSVGMEGTVSEFDEADDCQQVKIEFVDGRTGWPDK